MSRKGKSPIAVTSSVKWEISENEVTVTGPRGTLKQTLPGTYELVSEEGRLFVKPASSEYEGAMHGLARALVNNMIEGVTTGFKKQLELVGVGYRAAVNGNTLDLQLGFSHPTKLTVPDGIKVEVERNVVIVVSGEDKQKVGQFAAEIRALKKPEPYKGKGIRYSDEHVRRKAGKTSKK